MNKLITKFGQIVGQNVEDKPQRAFSLLKAAYMLSGWQIKFIPNKKLSPSEKYMALLCNQAIQQPLRHPERSAIVNLFLPCNVLHAMDIAPQFTEGLACYLNGAGSDYAFIDYAENSGVPKSYCSYHKVLLGAALSGVLPKPRFILNTTLACDANTSTFRKLAQYYHVPQYTVDVPNNDNDQTVKYVTKQLEEMTAFIEDILKEHLDHEKLRQSIQRENRSVGLYRSYLKELSGKFIPGDLTSEMYRVFMMHILRGTKQAQRYFKLLLEGSQKATPMGDKIRILWVHTIPFWQDSFRRIFNFSDRYQLLCCDLNFDALMEIDEENIYQGMARKLLNNTLGGTIDRRARNILDMAKWLKADGVVYFCHWGCKSTLGGAQYTTDFLKQEGIPALVLDGDGCDRNNINEGQMLTRIQAFLEMLEETK